MPPGSSSEQHGPDYYGVLGVPEDASRADVTRAYRRLARTWHPDARPVDPSAEERFREINDAYRVLGDAETRRSYDAGRRRPVRRGRPIPVRRVDPSGEPAAPRSPQGAPWIRDLGAPVERVPVPDLVAELVRLLRRWR